MRVRLKGIKRVRARLADGRIVVYGYAWTGGPRLQGTPSTPEFQASYNEAVAKRLAPQQGVLLTVLRAFSEFAGFSRPRATHPLGLHRQDQAHREKIR
jgi:hypothetical protein